MKRTLTTFGKFNLHLACLLILASSAMAQNALRKALDFDGDNKADYLIFRPSNNWWYITQSGGGYDYKYIVPLFPQDYLTPGDYDGDNKADIAVWRDTNRALDPDRVCAPSGTCDTNGIWSRYNSSNNTFFETPFGIQGDEPVARDYDGDGKTDIAVVRRSNGYMYWHIIKSSNGAYSAAQFGYATDYVAPGDYDGDGKFDLAIKRPGTITLFYIYRSSDNVLQTVSFGESDDLVVPGDYDGDGKTDIAVVRLGSTPSSNLIWHIQQSRDGYKAVSFGLTGSDQPVQGDYDGDGKTDIAVWRETGGYFYVLRSSDNGWNVVQWGASGDFPVASYDTH